MVAVKAHEAERMLAAPGSKAALYLFYGPDHGLVAERAERIAKSSVADPGDPFQLVRLDGGTVAGDPLRLVDEANTIGLFGGIRAIWVAVGPKFPLAALEPILRAPPADTTVILEAGDLARSSPLRLAVERAKGALAIPCYNDDGRGIETVIDTVLAGYGVTIARDARTLLSARLGVDRRVSRREVEKLATYAGEGCRIEADDVDAIVGDASARAVDDIVDGVFTGALQTLDSTFRRLSNAGEDAGVLLGFVIRHAQALLAVRTAIDISREPPAGAVAAMRGVNFPRRKLIELSLARWSAPQLAQAISTLHGVMAQVRLNPGLSGELATRALWNLALSGGRR